MKKVMCITAGLMLLGSSVAFADYSGDTKKLVIQEVGRYFQMEQGNRVTEYSMKSLIQNIQSIFDKNVVKQAAPAEKPAEKK